MIKTIGIFCGSSKGLLSDYEIETQKITNLLISNNLTIVYGGGNTGLMGVVAETGLNLKGNIIGVAPGFIFEKEVVRNDLTDLIITRNMLDRKEIIMQKSDAFIVLPGGIGTLDEFFEVFTALQLETMMKPIAILNTNQYFTPLISMLKNMVEQKFLRKEHFDSLIIEEDPEILIKNILNSKPKKVHKWVEELKIKQQF